MAPQADGADPTVNDRRARFAERMQNLSPEEREAMMARMRERGIDPANPPAFGRGRGSAPGLDGAAPASGRSAGPPRRQTAQAGPVAGNDQAGASTIDALFAPLPRTETVGRAWLYVEKTLRPLRLRLGITDGQTTELLEGDLTEGQELVTNVTIAGQTTRPAATAFPGFGAPGGRQGFPGGGGFNGGGGAGRGR